MATTAIKTSTQVNELTRVWTILKFTFGLVPIVAGLDKFTNILTDWSQYLNPAVANMLPVTPEGFMMIVGVIEIVAGFIVLFRTELGAYIVSAWLVAIALTLITSGNFLDVAVRDLVMAIGAFCLGRLTHYRTHGGA
ncbi:MAG TPA: hypothetical protein VK508_06975 [Cyclobacteriaceae bacterium]|nr:hypothetical protein [Cyclobacteriaceae bacterium]